ncbi:hypothetical protein ACLK1S_18440 [Escherichia coli]
MLCELDGVESDVQEDCERVNDILLKAGATSIPSGTGRSRAHTL